MQIDLNLITILPYVRFALNALVSEIEAKSTFYPDVLILDMAAILVGWSPDTFCKLDTPMMIVAKSSLIWPSSFRGEGFGPGELKI